MYIVTKFSLLLVLVCLPLTVIVFQVVRQVTNSDKQLNSPALSDPGREKAERVFSCFTGSQTSALENL